MKPLLKSEDIVTHLEEKGVTFNNISKEQAAEYLRRNNYYMKLGSYRFNYQKRKTGASAGTYINLDFSYLKELAIIDMHLRYEIVEMCLSIEHFLKVRLMTEIEGNGQEDGYHLVQKFIANDKNLSSLKKIQSHKSSAYCNDLIEKYYPYFPAWVFIELISFGELAFLCDYYNELYGIEICNKSLLNSVRDIRNASAHSNCLINHLFAGDNKPDPNIVRRVRKISSLGSSAVEKKMKNKCLYDFSCLLLAYHDVVQSSGVAALELSRMKELFDVRIPRNKAWFAKNNILTSAYSYSKDFLDNLSSVMVV